MKIQGTRPTTAAAPPPMTTKPAEPQATTPGGWSAKASGAGAVSGGAQEAKTRAAAEAFFKAFGQKDLKALEAAYAPDVKFKDDMFTLSKRESVMKMWTGAPPFKTFDAEVLEVKGNTVKARWTCEYEMFGKPVRNEIESTLTFDAQGRITSQQEHWDTQKWMSQALPVVPKWAQGAVYAVLRPFMSWKMGG